MRLGLSICILAREYMRWIRDKYCRKVALGIGVGSNGM
jgi:hypothetical protein